MKQALDKEIEIEWETFQIGSILADKLKEVYTRYVLYYFRDMLEEGRVTYCVKGCERVEEETFNILS